MIWKSALACLALATSPALADRPLAAAASEMSVNLAAGCIVTGESISGSRSFSNSGQLEPADIDPARRIFEIGSISKVFTGLLLADAVLAEKVQLSTSLEDLLGDRIDFQDARIGKITLLQLATHTSGLPRLPANIGPNPDASEDPYAAYDRKLLQDYLSTAKLDREGPFPSSYSNLGMGLLGDLLAEINHLSWEDLVAEKITKPLGMKDTVVVLGESQAKRLAPPYRGNSPNHSWSFQALAGAGALRSTAEDLLRFGESFVNPDDSPIGDAIRLTCRPQAVVNEMGAKIGLGIFIGNFDGEIAYDHSGGTGGYRTMFQVIPANKTVRVVLINNDSVSPESVVAATRDLEPDGVVQVLPKAQLDEYSGVYRLSDKATFTVLRVNEELRVRLTGQPFLPVEALGDDEFKYAGVAAKIKFTRKASKISSLTLLQNGRELVASKTPDEVPNVNFPSEESLKPYVGEYQLSPEKSITVTVSGDSLFAQLTGQTAYPVFQVGEDHFEYDVVRAQLHFERDEDDRSISRLILIQNGSHAAPKLR